jgi:hypothetical protein
VFYGFIFNLRIVLMAVIIGFCHPAEDSKSTGAVKEILSYLGRHPFAMLLF